MVLVFGGWLMEIQADNFCVLLRVILIMTARGFSVRSLGGNSCLLENDQ